MKTLWWCFALAASALCISGCAALKELDQKIETWGPPGSGIQFSKLPAVINILASYEASPEQTAAAQRRAEEYVAEVIEKEAPPAPKPVAPEPEPIEPSAPEPKPVEQVAKAPLPVEPTAPEPVTPVPEPAEPTAPEPEPVKEVAQAPEPAKPPTPEAEPVVEAVPTPTLEEVANNPDSGIIAIEVPQDGRSKGKKSVMLWHTHSRKLVGTKVYDIEQEPEEGETVQLRESAEGDSSKWRTYTALFVSSRTRET